MQMLHQMPQFSCLHITKQNFFFPQYPFDCQRMTTLSVSLSLSEMSKLLTASPYIYISVIMLHVLCSGQHGCSALSLMLTLRKPSVRAQRAFFPEASVRASSRSSPTSGRPPTRRPPHLRPRTAPGSARSSFSSP